MAAIVPFIEDTEHINGGPANSEALGKHLRGLGDFGALTEPLPLRDTHAQLTRTLWIRRLLERALVQRRYRIVQNEEGELSFQLINSNGDLHPIAKNEIPWMPATKDHGGNYKLWGEAQKMACPTWDLPAGGLTVGGACPGADAGQTIVHPSLRAKALESSKWSDCNKVMLPQVAPGAKAPQKLREDATICQYCYATEGNYPSPHVQASEILRYWWCAGMIQQGRQAELVDTIVHSMRLIRYPVSIVQGQQILPVRIHSAGDFFSPEYAEVWVEVANRLAQLDPRIRLWAPTRTWAKWEPEQWQRLMGQLKQDNLIVRASAYHINDAAPEQLVQGRNARGSTAIFEVDNKTPWDGGGQSRDPRYEWNCQVYALPAKFKKTCANAMNPEGNAGCRVCWAHPEMRVNYTVH